MTDRQIMEALLAGRTVKNAKTGLMLRLMEDGGLESQAAEDEDACRAAWVFSIGGSGHEWRQGLRYDRISADD